jgi:Putative Flp pilus-assembly TadE/G-like
LNKIDRSPRGQALIIIVFSIVALVGIIGLAVDGGNAYSERRRAQNAADAAALAGAVERVNNNTPTWVNAVYTSAALNGYNNDGVTNIVSLSSPPVSGTYVGNVEYIQVVITSHLKTYFASVLGIPEITNKVEAISRTPTPQFGPLLGGAAVVSLAPTSDCDMHKAFFITEEATLSISGGGVFINSNNPTCALIEQGGGSIRIKDNSLIQIVGGAMIQKPKLLTPYPPQTHTAPIPYPPPFYMPKVGCGSNIAKVSEDGSSMSSGNYPDTFPPKGVTHLGGGVYCLDSDFIMGETQQLDGNGVVIYMKHGSVRLGGRAQINISAIGNGPLAGLLIYQPITNTNYLAINGNSKSGFGGTILAPGAQIRINGLSSNVGYHSQIIGFTIEVNGQDNVLIKIIDNQNLKAWTFPTVQFSK